MDRYARLCWQLRSDTVIKATGCHIFSFTCVKAHLTQLLVQSGGPGLSGGVALGTEHLLVPVNEVAVAQSDHLDAETWTRGNGRGDLAC